MATNAEKRLSKYIKLPDEDIGGQGFPRLSSKTQAAVRAARLAEGKEPFEGVKSYVADEAEQGENLRPYAKKGLADERQKVGELADQYQRETKDKGMAKGGKVSSASSRADGCAVKGKTKGRFV